MHMRTDTLSVFDVPVDAQDFQRKKLLRYRLYLHDPRLFLRLPDGRGKEVIFSVHVAADPRPGMVDIMIDHQHFCPFAVDDPARSGEVGELILAPEQIGELIQIPKHQLTILFFLFIKRNVVRKHLSDFHASLPFACFW